MAFYQVVLAVVYGIFLYNLGKRLTQNIWKYIKEAAAEASAKEVPLTETEKTKLDLYWTDTHKFEAYLHQLFEKRGIKPKYVRYNKGEHKIVVTNVSSLKQL